MTVNLCFLQAIAVATSPQRQPAFRRAGSQPQPSPSGHWLGLGLVVALHIAGLCLIPDSQPEAKITPPQAIMVNWIAAPAAKAPTPTPPPAAAQPKPETAKPKTKPLPQVAKPKPVLATHSETASPISVPAEPAPAPAPPAPAAAASAEAAPAPAKSSEADGNQAPLTLPNLNADYLNNPPPAYPSISRQLGEQGKVYLRVLVNVEGNVEQVALRKSSGYERLDAAAQETVKKWRFVPAKRAEQAVAAWVVVPISFSLEG
ncbi:hypothetical protein A1507_01125 [Methylomonas koyamae]|uniref:TonB C-terminal domain-containing protein n=1 Tax=Methylomonas koyamae TaxID=702114 RepID=A0A177NB43_9GAMM|nr:energy transducer TonB [Methylomonas koyamae]OAI14834.1 hypothetical protein A1507_01125 [Methylomonas koyamae]